MILNEKIKASEVHLTGVHGEDLGFISTKEALRMAKELKVDLVCLSLTSSPPPCKLVNQSSYKEEKNKVNQKERKVESGVKVKEIRFSASIEEHDYDTKKRQAERILTAGDAVQLSLLIDRKDSKAPKQLAERLIKELAHCGKQNKGTHVSGKQVEVVLYPK